MTFGRMVGTVTGNSVSVNIDLINVLKSTGATTSRANGQFTGAVSGTTITGTLNGRWGAGTNSCTATNHSFRFTRQ